MVCSPTPRSRLRLRPTVTATATATATATDSASETASESASESESAAGHMRKLAAHPRRAMLALSMRIGLASSVIAALVTCGTASALGTPFPSAWLPRAGDGYLIPPTWAERGLRYGTPDLVGLIERAARTVAEDVPGATLYIADLSLKSGAWTQWHRSHRNGCDADLIFYATDDSGDPRPLPRQMVPFDADGLAWTPVGDGGRLRLHFDTPRNWTLVRALLTDEETAVSHIFIARPLRARLLAFAASVGESPALVEHAASILVQPGDSEPHNDHMHVRIAPPVGLEPVAPEAQPQIEATYARATVTRAPAERAKPHKLARHHKKKKAKKGGGSARKTA
jgi:Penicillin-insensitive murein endopeptidase